MGRYVTVAELRDWLSIPDTIDDVELNTALNAAEADIDAYCGWAFDDSGAATARTVKADYGDRVWLPWPFSTTTGLVVKTDTGNVGTFDATWTITTDYVVHPSSQVFAGQSGYPYFRIDAVGSRSFPTGGHRERVEVTAQWGWAATPAPIKWAAMTHANRIHTRGRRDDPTVFEGVVPLGVGLGSDIRRQLEAFRRPDLVLA